MNSLEKKGQTSGTRGYAYSTNHRIKPLYRITLIQEHHTKHIRIEFHTTELWWTLKLHLHHANKSFSEFSMNQETPNKAEMRDQSSLEIVQCRKSWLIDSPAPLHTALISNDILALRNFFPWATAQAKESYLLSNLGPQNCMPWKSVFVSRWISKNLS